MEDFWQTVSDILTLLLKVTAVLVVIDIVCLFAVDDFRVPVVSNVIDTLRALFL